MTFDDYLAATRRLATESNNEKIKELTDSLMGEIARIIFVGDEDDANNFLALFKK